MVTPELHGDVSLAIPGQMRRLRGSSDCPSGHGTAAYSGNMTVRCPVVGRGGVSTSGKARSRSGTSPSVAARIDRHRCVPVPGERLTGVRYCVQRQARSLTFRLIAAARTGLIRLLELPEGERAGVSRIGAASGRLWKEDGGLMTFLTALQMKNIML